MEGTSRNNMSQELRKMAVQLWRYGRNTGILAYPPYDTIDNLRMLWDHSQSISMHEEP
jgi:alpha-D-ribose 1-methylphosphonate 5-phosphate C-P lyase